MQHVIAAFRRMEDGDKCIDRVWDSTQVDENEACLLKFSLPYILFKSAFLSRS